jgi:hypothetical protein
MASDMAFDVVAAKQKWCGTGSESEIGKRLEAKREESASGRVRL